MFSNPEQYRIPERNKKKKEKMKEIGAKTIPTSRRQIVNDPKELPDRYSSTPGGTLYSTTPGGKCILFLFFNKNFLQFFSIYQSATIKLNLSNVFSFTKYFP